MALPATAAGAPQPGPLPILFGPPERPLFGHFHAASGTRRPVAAVLCNPLGHEALCAHRTLRHLAERLAAQGIAALRYDHDGTGDSAGGPEDAGRVRAWVDGVG